MTVLNLLTRIPAPRFSRCDALYLPPGESTAWSCDRALHRDGTHHDPCGDFEWETVRRTRSTAGRAA